MDRERGKILEETAMQGSGSAMLQTALASTFGRTVISMKESGEQISDTGKAVTLSQMGTCTSVSTDTALHTELARISGLMAISTKEHSLMGRSKAKEFGFSSKSNGSIEAVIIKTCVKVLEHLNGAHNHSILANTNRIGGMGMVK